MSWVLRLKILKMVIALKRTNMNISKYGKIIYNDRNFYVIDKKSGIKSEDISSLICHRLDRDTSGILIVAKNKKTKEIIQQQFKNRKVKKRYLALVIGKTDDRFLVEGFITRDRKRLNKRKFQAGFEILNYQFTNKKHERFSKTDFKILKIYHHKIFKRPGQDGLNFVSLIEAWPETGRTHQIRIHLASLNHPILGDNLYGGKIMREVNEKLGIERLLLHASKISFINSTNNKKIIIHSPQPQNFNQIIKKME